jgi:hypothetical protein
MRMYKLHGGTASKGDDRNRYEWDGMERDGAEQSRAEAATENEL